MTDSVGNLRNISRQIGSELDEQAVMLDEFGAEILIPNLSPTLSSEVVKALLNTRELYERWRAVDEGRDIRSIEEQEWAATELRNALRSDMGKITKL